MNSRTGDLARSIEARKRSASVDIGTDTTHEVVRRRSDGDEVARELQSVLGEKGGDSREAGLQVLGHMPHVQVNRPVEPLARDRSSHDIARSQLKLRMVARH